jgi:integrase
MGVLMLLTGNAPRVGSTWTDSGSAHDERHLKHRAKKATRSVPIPPELAVLLKEHCDSYGTAADGRLFRGRGQAMLSESVYARVWQRARQSVLTDAQAASPLAARRARRAARASPAISRSPSGAAALSIGR